MDAEIGVVDSEIGIVNAEIGIVNAEIGPGAALATTTEGGIDAERTDTRETD